MRKILLMGNPNVGKSVVFSRLTGAEVIASNYAGTTVDFSRGKLCIGKDEFEIIDAPGTYSLAATNRAEEVAAEMLQQADIIINVVDATNLERNLFLTLQLLELGRPVVIALNMWDETKHRGIKIDAQKLGQLIRAPVIPTVALTGEGIKKLVCSLKKAPAPKRPRSSEKQKWSDIGQIVKAVQAVTHRHHTFAEHLSDATIKPFTGLPIALIVLFFCFWVVRVVGEGLAKFIFDPLFELCLPFALALSSWLGRGLLHDILIGKLIAGRIDFVQSMGILTTGIYVPTAMVLPYVAAFYLMLSLLEDSGYLPRLATLMDNVFHRLGMHGYGVVPLLLGLGCNVPGVLATRALETKKQRFIAATLLAICVPCMAQTAMIFGILGPYGMHYVAAVFATLTVLYIALGLLLNRLIKGDSPEIFLEIPPYRMPNAHTIFKKTLMRVKGFICEAIPWLFAGVLLVNLLYAVGFLEFLGAVSAPVMEGLLGLPREAVAALLVGFLRKDLAVGMLLPLGMRPEQLAVAATVLATYFPCAATFVVLLKELGPPDLLRAVGLMVGVSLFVGILMRLFLIGL